MKQFIFLILICSSAYSVDKVYPLGEETYGIVADDAEWTCAYVPTPNRADINAWIDSDFYIRGKATNLPIEFMFFKSHDGSDTTKEKLLKTSQETSTEFSDVQLVHEDDSSSVLCGTYFDHGAIGYFALLTLKDVLTSGSSFVMVVNIRDSVLDERFYQTAFELITPLTYLEGSHR